MKRDLEQRLSALERATDVDEHYPMSPMEQLQRIAYLYREGKLPPAVMAAIDAIYAEQKLAATETVGNA